MFLENFLDEHLIDHCLVFYIIVQWLFNFFLLRMLKFDIESKGARDVPQVDQPDLNLPSESELQMAQVGFGIGIPVKQIGFLFLLSLQCVYFSTES